MVKRVAIIALKLGGALLAACAADDALLASATLRVADELPAAHGSSLRWDDQNCGNLHVRCPAGARCWEGMCVPENASARGSAARASQLLEASPLGTWTERPGRQGTGRLDGVAVTPLEAEEFREVVVGSTGGGVWRAFTEGAPDWVPSSTGLFDWNVVHVERDLSDPSHFWAVGWNLLFSRTEGEEWEYQFGFVNARALPVFGALEGIRPPTHPRPFAQALLPNGDHFVLWSPPCTGLAVSKNGAQFDLELITPGDANNLDNCLTNIVVDRVSRFVYVATMHPAWDPEDPYNRMRGEPAHIYRSAEALGGQLAPFTLANTNLPIRQIPVAMTSVSSTETGSDRLVTVFWNGIAPTSTWVTEDGASWTQSATGGASQPDELAYFGSGTGVVLGGRHVQHSGDPFSESWTDIEGAGYGVDARCLLVDHETSPPTLWAGNDFGQVARWSWSAASPPADLAIIQPDGLNVMQLYYTGLAPTRAGGRRLFIGPQDFAPECFDDPIDSSDGVPAGSVLIGDSYSFALSKDGGHAYVLDGHGLHRADNVAAAETCSGVSWIDVAPLPTGSNVGGPSHFSIRSQVAVHPRNWQRVYVLRARAVAAGRNGGSEWEVRDGPKQGGAALILSSLFIDRLGALYVGTERGGVYRSRNDGRTWEPFALTGLLSPAVVLRIAASPTRRATPTFWFGTTDGLYRRAPSGEVVKVLGLDVPPGERDFVVSDVEVDPTCSTRVYAALGWAGDRSRHRGGILVSTDDGESFESLTAGEDLHEVPITDVEIDPDDSTRLYAATFGRGAWLYRWDGALPPCE